jgi:signal transduction histidine kinase
MWTFDFEQINKIIESTMQNREVFGVVVKEADETSIISAYARDAEWHIVSAKNDIPEKELLFNSADITFNGRKIGTVSVFVTPKFMHEFLLLFLLSIFASVVLLNICLVLILFQLLNRTVIKPLRAIEYYTLKVSAGDLGSTLIHEDRFFGELGNLKHSVVEMTKSLIQAQEELVRKEKLSILGQLAGVVGHELRNPLGVMNNAVYFLQTVTTDADDTVREYLNIIKKEIDTSQQIIADLLDFARTKTPQPRMISVRELIENSLARCIIPDNVSVRIDIPDTLPVVNVDPFQIRQAFQNLITNAIQAMPEGGVLTVAARHAAGTGLPARPLKSQVSEHEEDLGPDTCFVEISIKDTGEGILPENLTTIFQPLFTTKTKGIGLGLVVCKNLIEANGGNIGVESRQGEGATFSVVLTCAVTGGGNERENKSSGSRR